MACSAPRKRLSYADRNLDIISSLPVELRENILMRMPVKDAVRTSVLSKNWRSAWASMPELVLRDDELVPDMHGPEAISRLVGIVERVLFLREKPILKFDLSTKHLCIEAFDRWIRHLSRHRLTQFSFHLESEINYRITSDFFSCRFLEHIDLSQCSINLPQNFEGFKLLSILKLTRCTISATDTERLVCRSPRLHSLALMKFYVEAEFNIHAPKLTELYVSGDFLDLQLHAPNLISVNIGLTKYNPSMARVGCLTKFWQSLCGLRTICRIGLFASSIPYLADNPPVELPEALSYVNHMFLNVDLANKKERDLLFSLLQKAHNLKNLALSVRRSENTTSSSFGNNDSVFEHLANVSIWIFKASAPVLAFIKFILNSAPVLRKLTLKEPQSGPKETNPEVFKQLLEFCRASAQARVIIE